MLLEDELKEAVTMEVGLARAAQILPATLGDKQAYIAECAPLSFLLLTCSPDAAVLLTLLFS